MAFDLDPSTASTPANFANVSMGSATIGTGVTSYDLPTAKGKTNQALMITDTSSDPAIVTFENPGLFVVNGITADITADINTEYRVNTTGGPVEVTLPAGADDGVTVAVVDISGLFDTNPCSVKPQGLDRINGGGIGLPDINDTEYITAKYRYSAANATWVKEAGGGGGGGGSLILTNVGTGQNVGIGIVGNLDIQLRTVGVGSTKMTSTVTANVVTLDVVPAFIGHQSLGDVGTYTHDNIDDHMDDDTIHRSIDDGATTTLNLWSATKINTELGDKAELLHTHTAAQVTNFDSAADSRITIKRGAANGIASLDGASKVPLTELNLTDIAFQGTWDADTNTPTITSGVGTEGRYYITSVAGATLIDGVSTWMVGDYVIFQGTTWQRIPSANSVSSVAGKIGAVLLDTADITTGTFVDGRIAQSNVTQHNAALDHTLLLNKGSNTHVQIDNHISSTSNPHAVTKAQVGLGLVVNKKDNINATVAPGATDGSNLDYSPGSLWTDVTLDKSYICVDANPTAAVWKLITPDASNPTPTLDNAYNNFANNPSVVTVDAAEGQTGGLVFDLISQDMHIKKSGVAFASFTNDGTILFNPTVNRDLQTFVNGTGQIKENIDSLGAYVVCNSTDNINLLTVSGSGSVSMTPKEGEDVIATLAGASEMLVSQASGDVKFISSASASVGVFDTSLDGTTITDANVSMRKSSYTFSVGPNLEFVRSRGTNGAPDPVTTSDSLGKIEFKGFGDSTFASGCVLETIADSTWSETSRPTVFKISTCNENQTVPTEKIVIVEDNVTVNGSLYVDSTKYGLVAPRMTKVQRDAGTFLGNGDTIFNTTNQMNENLSNGTWYPSYMLTKKDVITTDFPGGELLAIPDYVYHMKFGAGPDNTYILNLPDARAGALITIVDQDGSFSETRHILILGATASVKIYDIDGQLQLGLYLKKPFGTWTLMYVSETGNNHWSMTHTNDIPRFGGATSVASGYSGLVTKPLGNEQDFVLHGDAKWRSLFPFWTNNTDYSTGAIVQYEGKLYEKIVNGNSGPAFDQTMFYPLSDLKSITAAGDVSPAAPNYSYACDTTSAPFTITLPDAPTNGTVVRIVDVKGNFAINAVSVIRSGTDTINGLTTAIPFNTANGAWQFVYNDAENRWTIMSFAVPTAASTFTGATSGAAGTTGLVVQPVAAQQDLILAGNATWRKLVPPWAASTAYSEGAVVQYLGKLYEKKVAGSTGAVFSDALFNTLADLRPDIRSTNLTAVANTEYFCHTVSEPFTITLPSAPPDGSTVRISDIMGNFHVNPVTVVPGGSDTINGSASPIVFSSKDGAWQFVYSSSQGRWIIMYLVASASEQTTMGAATQSTAGVAGAAPQPAATEQTKVLTGNGDWSEACKAWAINTDYSVGTLVSYNNMILRATLNPNQSAAYPDMTKFVNTGSMVVEVTDVAIPTTTGFPFTINYVAANQVSGTMTMYLQDNAATGTAQGTWVRFVDKGLTFDTKSVEVAPQGSDTIDGVAGPYALTKKGGVWEFLYVGTDWVVSINPETGGDLDSAYNNFGANPALITVDAAQGQTTPLTWEFKNPQLGMQFQHTSEDDSTAPLLSLYKKRLTTPFNVMLGDELGRINFDGFDTSTQEPGASIVSKSLENWNATRRGTSITFLTTDPGILPVLQDTFVIGRTVDMKRIADIDLFMQILPNSGVLASSSVMGYDQSTNSFVITKGQAIPTVTSARLLTGCMAMKGDGVTASLDINMDLIHRGPEFKLFPAPTGFSTTSTYNAFDIGVSSINFVYDGAVSETASLITHVSVLNNKTLGTVKFGGYTTPTVIGFPASITASANEDWSATQQGSVIKFNTTTIGTVNAADRLVIDRHVACGMTDGTFVLPRLSHTQRNALSLTGANVANMIWNTSRGRTELWNGSKWMYCFSWFSSEVTTTTHTALEGETTRAGGEAAYDINLPVVDAEDDGLRQTIIDTTGNFSTFTRTVNGVGGTSLGFRTSQGLSNTLALRTSGGTWTFEYVHADTRWHVLNEPADMVRAYTYQQGIQEKVLLFNATLLNWDLDFGQSAVLTLTGNITAVPAPTNMKAGFTYVLRLVQDATGTRTIAGWNAVYKWPAGVPPVLSTAANSIDIITFVSNGTQMYGIASLNFS